MRTHFRSCLTKEEVALFGPDSIVRFDAILNCVVVLGREEVRCNTHVSRCWLPPGFMCCAHGVRCLCPPGFYMLCSCCVVLVLPELPVLSQTVLLLEVSEVFHCWSRPDMATEKGQADAC